MFLTPTFISSLLLLLPMLNTSQAFSTGAPPYTCDSMRPGHPGTSQPLPGPYSLSLSKQAYIPFEVVNVTINAPESEPFLGFMLQARDTTTNALIGSFIPVQGANIVCNQVLTHSSTNPKSSQTFTWRAPVVGSSDVVFRATVVKDYFTFYVDFQSEVLKPKSALTTTSSFTSTKEASTTTPRLIQTTLTPLSSSSLAMTTTKMTTMTTTTEAEVKTKFTTNILMLNTTILSFRTTTASATPQTETNSTTTSAPTKASNTQLMASPTMITEILTSSSSTQKVTMTSSNSSLISTKVSISSSPFTSVPKNTSTPEEPATTTLYTKEITTSSQTPRIPTAVNMSIRTTQPRVTISMGPDVTSPSPNDTGQTDPESTKSPSIPRGTPANSFDTSEDDEDRNLTLYLSLGLVSGWACILLLGYIVRHFWNKPRPQRPALVSFA